MHLIFTTHENNIKFGIRQHNEITKDMEYIFSEYQKTRNKKLNKYIKLFKLEQKLGKMRSNMLTEMKLDFKEDFLPEFEEQNPEYFI